MTIEEAKIKLREYFEEACDVLKVNHQQIIFAYDHIGKRFRTESNTCETDGNTLFINEDWIMMVIRENFLYDLQYQMYHESRHYYQSYAIADFHARGKTSETEATIRQWEKENADYARNEGTAETQMANAAQTIEIDANAFAIVMLHLKGIDEARAPEEQMYATEKRAQEIYKTLVIMKRIPQG